MLLIELIMQSFSSGDQDKIHPEIKIQKYVYYGTFKVDDKILER